MTTPDIAAKPDRRSLTEDCTMLCTRVRQAPTLRGGFLAGSGAKTAMRPEPVGG